MKQLLATNANCELPCWWGIHPGGTPTPANIIFALQMPYHHISDTIISFAADYPINDVVAGLNSHISVAVVLTAGAISEIQVSGNPNLPDPSVEFTEDWQALALHQVFTKFGRPTEVMMSANTVVPEAGAPLLFSLDVIYADKGIAIHYIGGLQKRTGSYLICPSLSGVTSISLLLTVSGDIDHFRDSLAGWSRYNPDYSVPVQDLTGMSIENFYTRLKGASDACFRIIKS